LAEPDGGQFPAYRAFRDGRLSLISETLPGAFRAGCVSEAAGFRVITMLPPPDFDQLPRDLVADLPQPQVQPVRQRSQFGG
jgi:hypothetical protein